MSTDAKHTPGPWTVDGEFYVRCKAYTIASMWMGIKTVEPTPQRAQANARLIARAPEMAEQIAELCKGLEQIATQRTESEWRTYAESQGWDPEDGDYASSYDAIIHHARAVLAKHKKG